MESSKGRSVAPALPGMAKALLLATRPKQWTKNLLVFFALFFTVGETWRLGDLEGALSKVTTSTLAFVLFCGLTAAVYLVNDILDAERDRLHPRKRNRPIASGALPVTVGWTAAAALALPSLGLSFALDPLFGSVALGYLLLMAAYSLLLKRLIILDVFSISGGFVMRAVAGAAALDVPISPWLYTCTGLGALMIALGKRHSELVQAGDSAGGQRDTLEQYTGPLLDQFIAVVAPSTLLAYTLYTFTAPNLPDNHAMMLTIPFVVYGLFRYVYLVNSTTLGESPEEMLVTDIPLIASIVLWLVSAATILVLFR